MINQESIYGSYLPKLEETLEHMMAAIDVIRKEMTEEFQMDPVEHCLARIKDPESMREKCRRKGLPETTESAIRLIHDAVGIRIVCAFINDVYTIRERLKTLDDIEVIEEKDYIRHVKPNGYRSNHMILRYKGEIYVEIQLRTISMDTWAALEHHMKYKKEITGNQSLIVAELKRCADELASTDLSMQTLRDMILMN
ncbi:MAG: GTP pyrophosphokinase family protein [Eubacteriales bacterium]|nr:GTP pyrophosphokinase family protein [Eubacteriales bacterium]